MLKLGDDGAMFESEAPIQNLPNTIISHIFTIALSVLAVLPPLPGDARLVLAQVCLRWRTLILGIPMLWSNIGFAPVSYLHTAYLLENLREWATRSAGNSLSFNFSCDLRRSIPGSGPARRVEQLLYGGGRIHIVNSILLPFSQRLTSLVCLLAAEEIRSFLLLPAGTFSALTNIDVTMVNNFANRQSHFPLAQCLQFKVFEGPSSLTEASFHLLNGLHPIDLKLRWSQLVKLNFITVEISPSLCLRIMTLASAVNDFSAQVKFIYDPHAMSTPPNMKSVVKAFALTRLHLRLVDPRLEKSFMTRLYIPALISLRLERLEPFRIRRDMSVYVQIIQRCASTLTHLNLHEFPYDPLGPFGEMLPRFLPSSNDIIEAVLHTLPALETLRLPPRLHLHDSALNKLADGDILPRLWALDICPSSVKNALCFLSMVLTREENACFVRGSSTTRKRVCVEPITFLRLSLFSSEIRALEAEMGYDSRVGGRPPQGIEVVAMSVA